MPGVVVANSGATPRQRGGARRARDPSVMDAIRADLDIKPETEAKLRTFLDGFTKSFAA